MKMMKKSLVCAAVALVVGGAEAATDIVYIYDDLNRLQEVIRGDGPTLSYSYDEVGNITRISGVNPDSDGDGLPDLEEVNLYLTNPDIADTDIDGLIDGDEVNVHGTDALNPDTDNDGVNDGDEIVAGTDPLDPFSSPVLADGDLNGDGVVNAADVVLATQIILGERVPTAEQLLHGDVAPLIGGVPAPDGQFNLGDLLVIQGKAVGQIAY